MATIKSYTDLEQSKKLAEILPIESADMYWYLATKGNHKAMFNEGYNEYGDFELPCWSLSTLLSVLPYYPILRRLISGWRCDIYSEEGYILHFGEKSDNPVDACVDMIEKLHKLKLV